MTGNPTIYIVNGIAAFLFSSTGPVAIVIAVAASMGLGNDHVSSWLFAGFGIAGVISLGFSLYYRQPIVFAWSIPGTVLLLTALEHLPFKEVVGAYLATALLIFMIGVTGMATKILEWVPKPIVMAMVAGIFLDFGLNLVNAFSVSPWMSALMVASFVLITAVGALRAVFPPILGALVVGAIWVASQGMLSSEIELNSILVTPVWFTPVFSLQAMIELVVPLAVTVLMVQNAQGFAVLGAAGHQTPSAAMTMSCGIGSVVFALLGAVSMCVTGPSSAILSSGGHKDKQFIGAITYCVLAIVFGLFSGLMAWLAFQLPSAFIAVLGGLAVFKVLESAFVSAFSNGYSLGALTTLLVTVSDISLLNIGAPFWGLILGAAISFVLERPSDP